MDIIEIERKFLINELPENLQQYKSNYIIQTYLYINNDIEIRLRKTNNYYCQTIKEWNWLNRKEIEIIINEQQYKELLQFWNNKKLYIIEKERFYIPLESWDIAELDIYKWNNEWKIVIEVEFRSEQKANDFIPPYWFWLDITEDKRFKNKNIAQNWFPNL